MYKPIKFSRLSWCLGGYEAARLEHFTLTTKVTLCDLFVPVKYGIKSLKRIGTLHFSNDPPLDYWAETGI